MGAALTTTGRAGTARRPGSGKQGGKVYVRNQRQSPSSCLRLKTWWIRAGWQCTPVMTGDSEAEFNGRRGGHEECLRRTRDDAAGAELGTYPTDRFVVNVGTVLASPCSQPARLGDGKVRRRLMVPGRGGVLVVVGGRESRSQGEGGQRVRSRGIGTSGGRR